MREHAGIGGMIRDCFVQSNTYIPVFRIPALLVLLRLRRVRRKASRMRGTRREAMFDLEQFISDSKAALYQEPSQNSIREVVARAGSEPASLLKGLGEPKQGEIQTLYRARDLTILNVIWAP